MNKSIKKLIWDTKFFGFNVGKASVEKNNDVKDVLLEFEKSPYKLLYLYTKKKIDTNKIYNKIELLLADEKTTFLKDVNTKITKQPLIEKYLSSQVTDDLYDLAVQSGVYSRFKIDSKITPVKFEQLYKLWIEKIASKQNDEEIFVYKNEKNILGFLALGSKNYRADLIMGAVDSNVRGKGVGLQLFLEAERVANIKGFKKIQIVTQGINQPACNLYKKIGYQISNIDYVYHVWKKDRYDI